MLTADLVDARKKDGELLLRQLDREGRDEALGIGAALLEAARECVGRRREELEEAWDAAVDDATSKRFKLAAGLRKLVADACSFEAETEIDSAELRRVLFTHASAVRRSQAEGEPFDRDRVIAEAAEKLGLPPDVVTRALFADLKGEHVLCAAPTLDAESLVEAWELGQAQAVLITAVRITCEVSSASPGLVRAFFAKLKFHKLLFSAERLPASADGTNARGEGWKVVIDGPYSMFDAVTKYGVKLAFAFPALRSLEHWSLVADIRWGKSREPLVFRLASEPRAEGPADSGPKRSKKRRSTSTPPPPAPAPEALHLSDEVRELLDAINDAAGAAAKNARPWRARPATALLDVPGEGLCIPDLELSREGDRDPVYVEVLGYWSRDAVFRRVELAERGLQARVIFAVSSRLRVSAEVLDETASSSLYVYKGKMSPRAVLDHATRLCASS